MTKPTNTGGRMNWYLVYREEFSGYECDGHDVPHIVAASSKEEAGTVVPYEEWWPGRVPESHEYRIVELVLPDLSKKKKPFELNL